MHLLYIDESGDLQQMPSNPLPSGNDQPVLVISALIIDAAKLEPLTQDFLNLKSTFFPNLSYPSGLHLDKIIPEIKGSDLRRNATQGNRNQRRHVIGFLSKLIDLLEVHNVKLIGRVWVKQPGHPFDGKAIYTSSIQWVYTTFDEFLTTKESFGFVIADSRNPSKNSNVAHSIFTQKFRATTSVYVRILELPTFGHSENHAGIQICDLISSALLYPIACHIYCSGHISNVHVQADAVNLKLHFGKRLKNLQYRYQNPLDQWKGGIVVSDPIAKKSASLMF